MWAARASGGGVFFEEVADFEVKVWEVGGAAEPVDSAGDGFVFYALAG